MNSAGNPIVAGRLPPCTTERPCPTAIWDSSPVAEHRLGIGIMQPAQKAVGIFGDQAERYQDRGGKILWTKRGSRPCIEHDLAPWTSSGRVVRGIGVWLDGW
jgi:hypothetical protein